ncbi:MAG: phytanoyl-CoA dioxygenase family protein [Paenibacillus sp.]|jgi:ectoine hydroxylase-related dioxygenase (phytanoyl-CoA dioxygenase family)|nr:phytanoyl-CoA dioxygenase family protein [Paenibacillus sp.]
MTSTVSQEKIDFYQENGFVQFDNVLTQEETEELREAMEEAMAADTELSIGREKGSAYYKVLNQKVNVWRDSASVGKYSLHERFARIAMELAQTNRIRLFHDHGLWKMPGDSKPTPWHQDAPYWPMKETGALSMWLTLDDVDENNGCMMFVPGSHKIGKLTGINLVEPQNIFEFAKGTEAAKNKPVIVRMKAGSCTFHHGLTFHFAHANTTGKPRRVLAVIYMPDGTRYWNRSKEGVNDHIVTQPFHFKDGDPIQGRFFPILARW